MSFHPCCWESVVRISGTRERRSISHMERFLWSQRIITTGGQASTLEIKHQDWNPTAIRVGWWWWWWLRHGLDWFKLILHEFKACFWLWRWIKKNLLTPVTPSSDGLRCSGFLCHDFVLLCLSFSSHLIQQEIGFRDSVAAQETLSRVKSWWKWWIPQVRSADPKPVWGTTRAASLSFTHISLSSQKDRLDSSTQTSSDGVPVSQRKVGRVWLNKHNSSSVFSTKYLSVAVMLSYGRTVVHIYTVKRIWMLKNVWLLLH